MQWNSFKFYPPSATSVQRDITFIEVGDVFDDDGITRRGSWAMASSSSRFTNLTIRYGGIAEDRILKIRCEFGVLYNGITSIPNFMKIRPAIL
jgi:hypothetical protein